MKKPTLAALFAGCGGDSLGFVDADFELIYANDNNGDAFKTIRKKFENSSTMEFPLTQNIPLNIGVRRKHLKKLTHFQHSPISKTN